MRQLGEAYLSIAMRRLGLATHGITASGEGFERHRFARAMDGGESLQHRQALTRTAEARLGWTLTREGTVARRTVAASQRRATALQSMAKAKHSAAVAWSARRCEARPRLRSARISRGFAELGAATA